MRNWILLYIKKNAKRCAQISRSSYYRFTFLCLSFGHLVQNKYYEYQLTKRCFEERPDGFKVSFWFLAPSIWAPEEWKYARVTVHFWVWYQKPWTEVVPELSYESTSICCLWQRTVCTSADKIWRPTRVHAWSHFVFNLYQWLAQLVYFSHRSYFMRTMLSFTTLGNLR